MNEAMKVHLYEASRTKRVATTLNRRERASLRRVQRYVKGFTGIGSVAEALRYLVRNWSAS